MKTKHAFATNLFSKGTIMFHMSNSPMQNFVFQKLSSIKQFISVLFSSLYFYKHRAEQTMIERSHLMHIAVVPHHSEQTFLDR